MKTRIALATIALAALTTAGQALTTNTAEARNPRDLVILNPRIWPGLQAMPWLTAAYNIALNQRDGGARRHVVEARAFPSYSPPPTRRAYAAPVKPSR
ncbi:MAG: hypothetical protein CME06_11220 [Gemmatimonadetes bacterium]|nr:hypothetical protein [Gemmatimonadota bacterium]